MSAPDPRIAELTDAGYNEQQATGIVTRWQRDDPTGQHWDTVLGVATHMAQVSIHDDTSWLPYERDEVTATIELARAGLPDTVLARACEQGELTLAAEEHAAGMSIDNITSALMNDNHLSLVGISYLVHYHGLPEDMIELVSRVDRISAHEYEAHFALGITWDDIAWLAANQHPLSLLRLAGVVDTVPPLLAQLPTDTRRTAYVIAVYHGDHNGLFGAPEADLAGAIAVATALDHPTHREHLGTLLRDRRANGNTDLTLADLVTAARLLDSDTRLKNPTDHGTPTDHDPYQLARIPGIPASHIPGLTDALSAPDAHTSGIRHQLAECYRTQTPPLAYVQTLIRTRTLADRHGIHLADTELPDAWAAAAAGRSWTRTALAIVEDTLESRDTLADTGRTDTQTELQDELETELAAGRDFMTAIQHATQTAMGRGATRHVTRPPVAADTNRGRTA